MTAPFSMENIMSAGDPRLTESFPAARFAAVSLSDTVNHTGGIARALYVGVGGDVVAVGPDDVAVTFKNVPTGALLPIATKRVNNTSTTATNLAVLY
jgi:hypothetical protein